MPTALAIAFGVAAALAVAGGTTAFLAHCVIRRVARGRAFDRIEEVPPAETGLVLGTAEMRRDGGENRFFTHRVERAAALWHAGKVRHLLLSGSAGEPTAMARRLEALGVPQSALTLDPGGLRTVVSLRRAQEVYGVTRAVIISQHFHNQRALFLAAACGLQATACNAPTPRLSWKTRLREAAARLRATADAAIVSLTKSRKRVRQQFLTK